MLSMTPSPVVTVKAENAIEPLVVSLATAAKLAGVSDRHLRKYFVDGPAEYRPKLPVCRIGGRLTIRVATLNSWLAAVESSAIAK